MFQFLIINTIIKILIQFFASQIDLFDIVINFLMNLHVIVITQSYLSINNNVKIKFIITM